MIWADCPAVFGGRCSARFTLKVAQGINVVAHTDHGDVEVTDTFGSVEAVSEHGDVRLVMSGAPRDVAAETEHGDVEVVLPNDDGAFRVDAGTEHGSARTDVRVDPSSPRAVTARSQHGDVAVRYGGIAFTPASRDQASAVSAGSTRRSISRSTSSVVTTRA